MRRICRRFERWRKGHQGRLPILETLWAEAAREHRVFRAAKAQHLEYGKLKRIAETSRRNTHAPTARAYYLKGE
jgi:hypothetical protein